MDRSYRGFQFPQGSECPGQGEDVGPGVSVSVCVCEGDKSTSLYSCTGCSLDEGSRSRTGIQPTLC